MSDGQPTSPLPPGYTAPPGQVPPGYQPQTPYQQPGAGGPVAPAPAAPAASGTKLPATVLLSVLAAAGVAVATWVEEDDLKNWDNYGWWGIFAVVAALATMAPVVRGSFKMTAERAWQIAAGGAGGLVVWWALLILPSIEKNLSFVATVAVALGVLAVAIAPGRPDKPGSGTGETW